MRDIIKTFEELSKLVPVVKSKIIHMTSLAKSGHPGGPLSATETILCMINSLNLDKNNPYDASKDKIVISAGHYSAGIYASLAALELVNKKEVVVSNFRSLKDVVEGHVTHKFPFIWDSTGHLGYGPSISAGHAIADKSLGYSNTRIVCFMGDGEQTKGPILEALRFIKKYGLKNIIIIVDCNCQQLSGKTESIMPMDIKKNYEANGFEVISVGGNNIKELTSVFNKVKSEDNNYVILSNTVMGKGVCEAEGTYEYHGKPVKDHKKAIEDLMTEDKLEYYKIIRESDEKTNFIGRPIIKPNIDSSGRIVFETSLACRVAWGETLIDISKKTLNDDGTPKKDFSPLVVFDCDLAGSVGTSGFLKKYPDNFFQAGIQEHSTSIIAGTVSTRGVSTWLGMFGVFGHSMGYNEHFLTAVNEGNLKLITTHNSIDTGEDSKTHSPISYLTLNNHPGWITFCPCDANQTDAIVRYMAKNYGNMHLALGRSSLDIIRKQDNNEVYFDNDYNFIPGNFDVLRDYGDDAVIVTYGTPTNYALKAAEKLKEFNISVKVINSPTPSIVSEELAEILTNAKVVVTFEDHNVETGISKIVDSALLKYHINNKSIPNYTRISIGMKSYSKSATAKELYKYFGIDDETLVKRISESLEK